MQEVVFTINVSPATPVLKTENIQNTIIYCSGTLASIELVNTLKDQEVFQWYDEQVGGTNIHTGTNVAFDITNLKTYYVQASHENGCVSKRIQITLIENETPDDAIFSNASISECQQVPIQTLQPNVTVPDGYDLTWYDALFDGNEITNPFLNTVGKLTLYGELKNSNDCNSSIRTEVTLEINAAPTTPKATLNQVDQIACETAPIQTLEALAAVDIGDQLIWFLSENGTETTTNPALNTVGKITYFAASLNNQGCYSLDRIPVTLEIKKAPDQAIITNNQNIIRACQEQLSAPLKAEVTANPDEKILWYDSDHNIVSNPILNEVGVKDYFAEVIGINGCASLQRTKVTLEIVPTPSFDTQVTMPSLATCDLLVPFDGKIALTNVSSGTYKYTLSNQNGDIIQTSLDANFNDLSPDTYTIKMESTDPLLCYLEKQVTIETPNCQATFEVFLKAKKPLLDTNNDGFIGNPGDAIFYELYANNTGSLVLNTISFELEKGVFIGDKTIDKIESGASTENTPLIIKYIISEQDVVAPIEISNQVVGKAISVIGVVQDYSDDPSNSTFYDHPNDLDEESDYPTIIRDSDGIVSIIPGPALKVEMWHRTIQKENPELYNEIGEEILYDIVITNTGNVSLTNLTIVPDNVSFIGSLYIGDLDSEQEITLSTSHLISLEELRYDRKVTAFIAIKYRDHLNEDQIEYSDDPTEKEDIDKEGSIYPDDPVVTILQPKLKIPEGFSPDNDGINDLFEIEGLLDMHAFFEMEIFNRNGKKVFGMNHNGIGNPKWWDGISNSGAVFGTNEVLPIGTYFYIITPKNATPLTGWVYLTK